MSDDRSIYNRLVDVAAMTRDVRSPRGQVILSIRLALDDILADIYRDVKEGNEYFPGVSVITNPDPEENPVQDLSSEAPSISDRS